MKQAFLISLLSLITVSAFAQGLITGIVKDEQNIPVPGAAVYLASTKAATVTNADGRFTFSIMPAGTYDILIKMVGFKPISTHVQLKKETIDITVSLTELTVGINEVTIMPETKKKEYLNLFMDYFIGRTENSGQCSIKNLEALMYHMDKEKNLLSVSSNEFLEVENKALGYLIRFYLKKFSYNFNTKIVYYEGLPTFEDLPANARSLQKRTIARLRAYNGSPMHFFRSLINRTSEKEGFQIKKNIMAKPIKMSVNGMVTNMSNELVPTVETVQSDTLFHNTKDNSGFMNFTGEIYIVYTKEREMTPFTYSGYLLSRPADYGNYQISKVKGVSLPAVISANGTLEDPASVIYSGYWAYEKLADLMPLDYLP